VERRDEADRLVTHLRQHRLVGDGAAAEQGSLPLSPASSYCLTKLQGQPSREEREDGVGVAPELGQERRESLV